MLNFYSLTGGCGERRLDPDISGPTNGLNFWWSHDMILLRVRVRVGGKWISRAHPGKM